MSGVLMTVLSGLLMADTPGGAGGSSDEVVDKINGWDLGTFFGNAKTSVQNWFDLFLILCGVVLIGIAGYKIVKGLISKKGDTNWVMVIVMLLVGVVLLGSGFNAMEALGNFGASTFSGLGSTS